MEARRETDRLRALDAYELARIPKLEAEIERLRRAVEAADERHARALDRLVDLRDDFAEFRRTAGEASRGL